jgi:hypothetical protein
MAQTAIILFIPAGDVIQSPVRPSSQAVQPSLDRVAEFDDLRRSNFRYVAGTSWV